MLDRFRGLSRSRESSQSSAQRESGLNHDLSKSFAAFGHNEHASTITASTPATLPKEYTVNDKLKAKDTDAIVEDDTVVTSSADLWSAAYREAVSSLGEEVKSVVLKGERIEMLFASLEETNGELAGHSLFRRGAQRLQEPLKNFKLALDIASPLTSIEPTASTAIGVVRSVTAVSLLGSRYFRLLARLALTGCNCYLWR